MVLLTRNKYFNIKLLELILKFLLNYLINFLQILRIGYFICNRSRFGISGFRSKWNWFFGWHFLLYLLITGEVGLISIELVLFGYLSDEHPIQINPDVVLLLSISFLGVLISTTLLQPLCQN